MGSLSRDFPTTLAAFSKSRTLYPGEKQRLTLSFDLHELASFDAARSMQVLEAGDYVLRLGQSSADTEPVAVLRLEQETRGAVAAGAPGTDG